MGKKADVTLMSRTIEKYERLVELDQSDSMVIAVSMRSDIAGIASWLALAGVGCLGGCLSPGGMDERLIGRYQRVMAERGKTGHANRGLAGIEGLRPTRATQPPLKTVRDEQTGKSRIFLGLNEAVMRALANSLDIRVVSYDPEISRQEMVQAAAEFDYIIFGELLYEKVDQQVSSSFLAGDEFTRRWKAGLRQKTITGAQWELAWTFTKNFDVSAFAAMQRSYDNRIVLEVTQPLLRDAWPEFNLAALRIARLNHRVSMSDFRREVEQIVTDVISAYWLVIQARRDRMILQALLRRTIETRDRIDKRRAVDATDVEFKQSEAAVATRRAQLILSEKVVGDAQDRLTRLLADSQLNLLSDFEVVPTTPMTTERVQLDPTDQLLAALRYNPFLEQARLAIDIARVNIRVATNQALPRLDFSLTTTFQGLGPTAHQAGENFETGDFISYRFLFSLEYPIGNRERIAKLRLRKAERFKAIATLQNTADRVAVQVRAQIRLAGTAYEEMAATRQAVEASRDQLEALDATEELRRLTPEFLQVKLSAQETLSDAERALLRSEVSYNVALVELARVTGTVLELHRVKIAMPAVLGGQTRAEEPSSRELGRPVSWLAHAGTGEAK